MKGIKGTMNEIKEITEKIEKIEEIGEMMKAAKLLPTMPNKILTTTMPNKILTTTTPNEILMIEILAKHVDMKTLGKFACVSKWWDKALRNQEFIVTRNRYYPQSTRLLFADSYGSRLFSREHLSFSTTSNVVCDENVKITFLRKFSISSDNTQGRRVLAVCRDLVCTENDNYPTQIVASNPWTGQSIELPHVKTYIEIDHAVFEYLASKRKYVVVKLAAECKKNKRDPMYRWRTVVNKISFNHVNHSSSKKLKWERMEDVCPCRVRGGVFVDRFVFWLIKDTRTTLNFQRFKRGKNQLIVSLDVEKEEFGIINCPQSPYWKSHPDLNSLSITLVDLNGTLCLTDQDNMSGSIPIFELWALKHELGQWEMKYNIRLGIFGMHLACHKSSMEGKMILKSHKYRTWYVYNPKSNSIEFIDRPPLPKGKALDHESVAFFTDTWPPTILY